MTGAVAPGSADAKRSSAAELCHFWGALWRWCCGWKAVSEGLSPGRVVVKSIEVGCYDDAGVRNRQKQAVGSAPENSGDSESQMTGAVAPGSADAKRSSAAELCHFWGSSLEGCRGSAPRPPGFIALGHQQVLPNVLAGFERTEAAVAAEGSHCAGRSPTLFGSRNLSTPALRRSGCFAAGPYPPERRLGVRRGWTVVAMLFVGSETLPAVGGQLILLNELRLQCCAEWTAAVLFEVRWPLPS
jgi:hypothetical protein